jgi:hypothetical protein
LALIQYLTVFTVEVVKPRRREKLLETQRSLFLFWDSDAWTTSSCTDHHA